MTIKVASVSRPNYMPQIEFPAKPLLYVDDKVSLAASDLADNSHGGLGRAVFFSYRDLHGILQRARTHLSFETLEEETGQPWRLNSRIISASLGRGRHIELQKPVTITLRHLETDPRLLRDPTCVFWDYEVHGWSDAGCQLISSNQTFSVCQCDHLTNFGLLMRPVTNSPLMTHVRLDIVAYVVTSVVFLAICVLIFKVSPKLCLPFVYSANMSLTYNTLKWKVNGKAFFAHLPKVFHDTRKAKANVCLSRTNSLYSWLKVVATIY